MGTSKQLSVYVAYHDERPHPAPGQAPYLAVCNVRPDGSRPPGFPAYDDDGGFPERNAAYCELSVQRRLETRATSTYVGLCHYRRVFLGEAPRARRGEIPGTYHLPGWDWARPDDVGAGEQSLMTAVAGRDWCTAPPYDVRRDGFRSVSEQFVANHGIDLLRAVDRAVAELHPDLPGFLDHAERAQTVLLWNMFVGRREVLQRYSEFLWPVLDACAHRLVAAPAGAYQGRWAGFVAERLHGYWLQHLGVPAGVRTGSLPVALLQADGIRHGGLPPRGTRMVGALGLPPWHRRAASRLPASVLLRAYAVRRAGRGDRGGRGEYQLP